MLFVCLIIIINKNTFVNLVPSIFNASNYHANYYLYNIANNIWFSDWLTFMVAVAAAVDVVVARVIFFIV